MEKGQATLHYLRKGLGQPLLLLHGLGSSSEDWLHQIDAFSDRFDVIAPDFPLHGASPGNIETFSLLQCAGLIVSLIEGLELRNVLVVGVSMGGMIGIELATRFPQHLAGLCVVNALAECRPRKLNEWCMLASRRFLLKFVSVETIAKLMAKQLLPGDAHAQTRDEVISRWSKNHRESYIASFNAVVGWDALDKLSNLKCPLFMLTSEFDYTPVASKKVLAYLYPEGQFACLPNARHLVPLEKPTEFNQILSKWLDEQT
ncbi:alpha/beta fold hydrolase [Grimontia marina]|uniref:3-oxoadipate enol-lactonase 2 n=1 Tax=Grimontia marina TaxID=646534 RepID=A0A128FHX6_9GAMM|nr:alpha/beta hydrolase [Grimontia marina]CZF85871.1 3-oxoadipate enol-lactonase 2 [Grimontia marina]